MKKIVFSFILLFGAVLFVPQSSFAQVVVKSKHSKTKNKVVVKKTNRTRSVTVKRRPTHQHSSRVVVAKPIKVISEIIIIKPSPGN